MIQTPLRYEEKGNFIEDANGVMVVDGTVATVVRGDVRRDLAFPANLRRIVACVNYCEGVPTEALVYACERSPFK